MYWKTKWFSTSLGCMILLITQCAINSLASRKKYRKIPKISPGAYIFQRAFLSGLFLEGLMYGGKFAWKSIGLSCSGKEIYHFCFVLFCIRGQIPSTSPAGAYIRRGDLTEGFLRYDFGRLIFGGAYFRNFTVLPSGNYVRHGGPSLIVLCWFFLLVFFHCKILLETSILRVKTPKRAWGAVFTVRGPVTMYIEVGGGGGSKFGCSLFVAG